MKQFCTSYDIGLHKVNGQGDYGTLTMALVWLWFRLLFSKKKGKHLSAIPVKPLNFSIKREGMNRVYFNDKRQLLVCYLSTTR